MTSSPRAQCVITPMRFDCVPDGTNSAASKLRSAATSSCRALPDGSSPNTSSPTRAAAIAARIAGVGRVTVSLRKSVAMDCLASVLALQLRKEDHVANGGAVGQQHDQTVDADAFARRRRQPVFERTDVVGVVEHRLLVAGFLRRGLRGKARRLVLRVVELGEPVREFPSGDEELEAVG